MKVMNFIICDDIRTEVGNKHSLMGIYEDTINFNVSAKEFGKWPKTMRIGFFLKIRVENNEERNRLNKFKLNINYNDKITTMAEGIINKLLEKENTQGIILAIVFNKFIFENSGSMSVIVELLDDAGQVISNLEMPDKIKITETLIS